MNKTSNHLLNQTFWKYVKCQNPRSNSIEVISMSIFFIILIMIGIIVLLYEANEADKRRNKDKVMQYTCRNCGYVWTEELPSLTDTVNSIGKKFTKAGQEAARPLFPWTPITESKKYITRCPKCNSATNISLKLVKKKQ